jgi:hypothetical protein
LATAIEIRDDDGDGSAAIRTVRLKACQFIEGKPDGASVTVNVQQNVAAITPGYVVRLGKFGRGPEDRGSTPE